MAASEAALVAIGAIPGAWLRLRVVNHFSPLVPRKHWGTFAVNIAAAFALGLMVGAWTLCAPAADVDAGTASRALPLLVGTGFFGSLSTFSTFAVEVLATLRARHWREAWVLSLGSIVGGLLAAATGLALVRP
jgi:CrcB protein